MEGYVYENMWAGPPNFEGVCDVDDAAHALIRFDSGLTLDLNVTWAGNFPTGALPDSFMGFFGDKAGLSFQLFGDHLNVACESEGKNIDRRVDVEADSMFRDQMVDFARAVQSRSVQGATGPQATQVQRLIDAIYESSATQKAVQF